MSKTTVGVGAQAKGWVIKPDDEATRARLEAFESDDEDTGRRVTHYDPAMELIGQRAELARLREVEAVAKELARIVCFECDIIGSPMDTPYARDVLARARALGLLV